MMMMVVLDVRGGGVVIGFYWDQLNNILNIEHYFSISNFNYKVYF